ncbi:MAG: hypothetical protein AAF840_17535 [Bacteroidota bacterium]
MSQANVNFRPLLVLINLAFIGAVVFFCYLLFGAALPSWWAPPPEPLPSAYSPQAIVDDYDRVENGIHVATGLIYAEGFEIVRGTCTACHSAKLVTQNRATREGWLQMIRWMQATQGLWELGDKEKPILDYLAKHYAPEEVGRRANLDVAAIEWYILELEE